MKKKLLRAVALAYNGEKDRAPRVVAKGTGITAERIIDTALDNNVPVREQEELAEALRILDLGQCIPEELYVSVARILAEIIRVDRELAK